MNDAPHMDEARPRVGLVTFTDDRVNIFSREHELNLERTHKELRTFLEGEGFVVVDAMERLRGPSSVDWFGVHNPAEVRAVADYLREGHAECMVIASHFWTPPGFAIELVKRLDLPVCIYAERMLSSIICIGAGLQQVVPNRHALTHERLVGKERWRLPHWVRGVSAVEKLKYDSAMLFGSTYCLRMEHLEDDHARLKRMLIGDLLIEEQSVFVARGQRILREEPERIARFKRWLVENGARICYDEQRVTEHVLDVHIADLLGLRQRLAELSEQRIRGVSVRCQPELAEERGITACSIPAFLPFAEDAEGPQQPIVTICEGDVRGLVTLMLLHRIMPSVPPTFGDLMYASERLIRISNCGAGGLYWAANSMRAKDCLPHVTLAGNWNSSGGAAFGYYAQPGPVTVARLTRVKDSYFMHLARGEQLRIEGEVEQEVLSTYGASWPQHAVSIGVNPHYLVRAMGANHPCLTRGDHTLELAYACREVGLPIVRIDSDDELRRYCDDVIPGL
jgi:L-fucose isomerase-like protein